MVGEAEWDQALAKAPLDDVGAETLSRYRYQAELAARFAIAMLRGEPIHRIYCELHEDYVVVFSDGRRPCLVSVKHLESNQPRWTVQGLCQDGGVSHLYARWVATGRVATCLLQTNSGLRGGVQNAAELAEACARGDVDELNSWAERLAVWIGADTAQDCAEFLRGLRVEDQLPGRQHIRSANLVEHMPPCLDALGRAHSDSALLYDVVVSEIERASRNELSEGAGLAMADPDRHEIEGRLRELLMAKTITADRLHAAFDGRQSRPGPALGILSDDVPGNSSRLVAKLQKGGVGPTGVRNARSLRLNWTGHRERWTPGLPQSRDPFADVEAKVLALAHQAESAARRDRSMYGREMESELAARLQHTTIAVPGDPTGDVQLLLGCAYELTNRCHIYWSDEFDVDGTT